MRYIIEQFFQIWLDRHHTDAWEDMSTDEEGTTHIKSHLPWSHAPYCVIHIGIVFSIPEGSPELPEAPPRTPDCGLYK